MIVVQRTLLYHDYPPGFVLGSLAEQGDRLHRKFPELSIPATITPKVDIPEGYDGWALLLKPSVPKRLGWSTSKLIEKVRRVNIPNELLPPHGDFSTLTPIAAVWQKVEDHLPEHDFVILPVTLGRYYRSKPVYLVNRDSLTIGQLPFCLSTALMLLVSVKGRFLSWRDLKMDIPGCQWKSSEADSDGMPRAVCFMTLDDGSVGCNLNFSSNAYSDHGSAVASIAHLNL